MRVNTKLMMVDGLGEGKEKKNRNTEKIEDSIGNKDADDKS
jgi:hypothetical protein